MEDEDDNPVGCPPPRDPLSEFRRAAEASGLIRPGDPLDQNVIDFAYRIVERCACIAEPYFDEGEGNAGDHIRAELGEL